MYELGGVFFVFQRLLFKLSFQLTVEMFRLGVELCF